MTQEGIKLNTIPFLHAKSLMGTTLCSHEMEGAKRMEKTKLDNDFRGNTF